MVFSTSPAYAFERRSLSVRVEERSYDVEFPAGATFDLDEPALARLVGGRAVLLVVDDGAYGAFGGALTTYATAHFSRFAMLHSAGGELIKTLDEAARICQGAADIGLPRDGVIVAVGGGALIDTAGFAASIYRRGVGFVRVPTTLVGLVDVSVGIKHAVNFARKKNALGTFYPPIGSIVDRGFLATLPTRFLASGFAEIIKLGLVCDADLFAMVERDGGLLFGSSLQRPPAAADALIHRSCAVMIDQLKANLYERDLRRLADFGHTFSQKIEAETGITHGEAVGLDMLISVAIAIRRRWCDAALLPRLLNLYRTVELPLVHSGINAAFLEAAAAETIAHRAGALHLVVPAAIGEGVFVEELRRDELAGALRYIRRASTEVTCVS